MNYLVLIVLGRSVSKFSNFIDAELFFHFGQGIANTRSCLLTQILTGLCSWLSIVLFLNKNNSLYQKVFNLPVSKREKEQSVRMIKNLFEPGKKLFHFYSQIPYKHKNSTLWPWFSHVHLVHSSYTPLELSTDYPCPWGLCWSGVKVFGTLQD